MVDISERILTAVGLGHHEDVVEADPSSSGPEELPISLDE
jgi:hypothetical protein